MRATSSVVSGALIATALGCSPESAVAPSGGTMAGDLPSLRQLQPGSVEHLLRLTPRIDLAEGIAVDARGTVYVSNRRLAGEQRISEILAIAPDGRRSVFAVLGPGAVDAFDGGVLGLAIDRRGDVYAALSVDDDARRGVWKIGRDGRPERLPGSGGMRNPNALTFDADGDLYVTDSDDGTIWRFPRTGAGALWLRHPLLAHAPGFGVGANGIVFQPPRTLFVANTEQGLIARIPIERSGGPGEPRVVASGPELLTVDGLAIDPQGFICATIVFGGVGGPAPVVRVDPATGAAVPLTDQWGAFDFPTSLAFGSGKRGPWELYVVNSGLFPEDREAAPGVTRLVVGPPGQGR
jgi:sugar lactone lactonase YvrE